MKKLKHFTAPILASIFLITAGWSRDIDPIISTDWLAQNLGERDLIIVDIRTAAQYAKGHIPGSISTPFSLWAITHNGLSLELPSDEALRNLLETSGIWPGSVVVVVTRTETDYGRADATRVAWTCKVAGMENVAVLDGGYTKWAKEKRAISTEIVERVHSTYAGVIDRSSAVSKSYVKSKIGKSIFADTRTPDDYFGITSKLGHIKSALNLPTPWIFNTDGTFKTMDVLQAMASGVLGTNKKKEIIVYCEVGGYAATWWFVLTRLLGYQNVKLYDGSTEEWDRDAASPVSKYSWR